MASYDLLLSSSIIEGATNTTVFPLDFTDASINLHALKDVTIAAGAVDSQVSLDGITGKHLLVKFSATVSVKLNGTGSTAITLTPSANNPAAILIVGGNVTSLHVTNPGGAAVECKLFVGSE